MAMIATVHTSSLDPDVLQAIRTLLEDNFDGDINEHDYEHALGGMHVLIREDTELIGALGASEDGADFYAARGWQRWSGTASVMTPNGLVRTKDEEGSIFALPVGVR